MSQDRSSRPPEPGRNTAAPTAVVPAPAESVWQQRASAAAQIARTVKAWRKASGGAGRAQIPQSGGATLPGAVRQRMEPKLGADLSDVKIHTGGESARAASDLGARAFTVDNEVHFSAGEFAPGTKEGDRLLAHELTHVVQAQRSGIQRKAEPATGGEPQAQVSDPNEPAEKEADHVADGVADQLHDDGATSDANAEDGAQAASEKAPAIGAKLHSGGPVIYRAERVGYQPGFYNNAATNVNQGMGTVNTPKGRFLYADSPKDLVNGKPTKVRTEIVWRATNTNESKTGAVTRSLKLEADGTRTMVCDVADLENIPREERWVDADGQAMVQGRGTPLHVYLTVRQMHQMGISEGDLGKSIKKVKMSAIVNRETIWKLAKDLNGAKGTPSAEQLKATKSVDYGSNYIIQNGGQIVGVSWEMADNNWEKMSTFKKAGEDPKALCGIDPKAKPDAVVPVFFNIILDCAERVVGGVPDDVPTQA
jgi:hypothetical protein